MFSFKYKALNPMLKYKILIKSFVLICVHMLYVWWDCQWTDGGVVSADGHESFKRKTLFSFL